MAGNGGASRVTGEEREALSEDVVRRYEAGASIRELAQVTGRSYGFVHRLLKESDVEMRGRGGATRNRSTRLDPG